MINELIMRFTIFGRRFAQVLIVLVGSTFLLAMLLQLLPVGLEELYVVSFDEASRQQQLERLRLDRNPVFGYFGWLWDFVRGDFGQYIYVGAGEKPVSRQVSAALPVSLRLVFYVQVVSILVSVPLGIYTAYRAGQKTEKVVSNVLFTASAIPNFVLALLFAGFFGVTLGWFPPLGYVGPSEDLVQHFRTMALPVLALAIPLIAAYTRILRTDMIASLREDYVTMAASKGLSNRRILFRHVLRPSSITLLTSAALNMGGLIGGAVVIEQIFSIPGMGTEIAIAIFGRQYFALQSYVALIAVGYVLFNVFVDLLIGFVDPRARERRSA